MRGMIQTSDKNQWLYRGIELAFIIMAGFIAMYIARHDFVSAAPLIIGMGGFVLVRFALQRPFHHALTLYFAVVAFNYYYFYCAGLTGRNPTDVGPIGTPVTPFEQVQKDILFMLMMGIAGVSLFVKKMEARPILAKRLNHPLMISIFAFMIYTLLRSFFYVFEGDSVFNLALFLRNNVEFAVIPALLCTTLITREKHLRLIFKGLIYTLPIVAGLGIIEFLINGSAYSRNFYGGEWFTRAASTLQNPNNLGAYLVTTMGVYIVYFFNNKLRHWERTLFWLAMPAGFACLFMTISRSSVLSFFIVLSITVALMFMMARQNMAHQRYELCRKLMLSYVFVLLLSTYVLFRYFDFGNALVDAAELYISESVVSRARLYAVIPLLFSFMENPLHALFGASPEAHQLFIDNAYAKVMARNGLVGFTIFGSIWIMSFKICLQRILDQSKRYSFMYLVCFYILLFQIVFGFTANIHENFPHNLYFWLTVGTIVWLETPFIKKAEGEANRAEIETLDVVE